IIDKHGWISSTRITKKNRKGYIRTVAIQLLFYCRFNDYSDDVSKFIGEGFEKLRFNAVEQYPHCGALWAHVATSRNKAYQRRFLNEMHRISKEKDKMEIPESDRFPEIGNVCDQASYAVGGSIFWNFKFDDDFDDDDENNSYTSLTISHIKGILRSTHYDMGVVLRCKFTMSQGSFDRLEQLVTKENMDKFMEKTMRILASYGQQHDSEILENAMLHKTVDTEKWKEKEPSERFKMIESEQLLFENAMYSEKEAILKWLKSQLDKRSVNNTKTTRATSESKKESETRSATKSGKSSVSNVETTTKVESATGDPFYAALLDDPAVIPRITSCQATEAEQAKYRAILDQIFAEDTIIAIRMHFAPDDVVEILSKVKEIIKTEPMLIEDIPGGITVVADIHGQLYDLDRVFKADSVDGKPGYECTKYLFLGDYVDRGAMSLEVVMSLFILKILYPDRIILLRGNHEFVRINIQYGFMKEMFARYLNYAEAQHLYAAINECFSYLSIAAIIGDKFFCAHGGISMGSFTRHEFRKLEKPYLRCTDDPLVNDVIWSDPANKVTGVCFDSGRGFSMNYGEGEFIHALERIGCKAMIRGHQIVTAGHAVMWGRLICIFTLTTDNDEWVNTGAVAIVDEHLNVHFRMFEPDTAGYAISKEHKKRRMDKQKEAYEKGEIGVDQLEQEESELKLSDVECMDPTKTH
ncbi:hypothetical protein PFISCL1PPCAC_850, partial [Pristionchus fissidentatus]